jgi:hypothetical protein
VLTKVKNFFKSVSFLDDITTEDIETSKLDWYNSIAPIDVPIKYTYFVQYHGYTHVVSWGPFHNLESAKSWVDSVQESHNISCNIIPALDPKSDSKKWPL